MPNKRRTCLKCEVSRWRSDFLDNFEENICYFCFFTTKIEYLTNKIKSSKNTDRSSGKVKTAEDFNEIKDLKKEVEVLKREIKSIKNVNISSGKVKAVASPPVSHPDKNISDNSTKEV